jgi:predicted CopG family antitoxin
MTRKTVSLEPDVYRRIRRLQERHETLSATLRRVLEAEKDPADYLDELLRDPPKVDVALLQRRRSNPTRSNRPASWRRRHAA